jgi:hypothetical protein
MHSTGNALQRPQTLSPPSPEGFAFALGVGFAFAVLVPVLHDLDLVVAESPAVVPPTIYSYSLQSYMIVNANSRISITSACRSYSGGRALTQDFSLSFLGYG